MYTTPLCTLILSLSSSHHLYAYDTQLFFSFYPSDLDANINLLRNALQLISSRMTANLLTLSTSKTEFLLIGLKQQLAKFHNCPIETTHSAHNLGIIFDEHRTLCDQISSLSKSCYFHIRAQIQNCLARTVVKYAWFSHITPVFKSLHWLKVKQRIEYKLLSLTHINFLQPLSLRIF